MAILTLSPTFTPRISKSLFSPALKSSLYLATSLQGLLSTTTLFLLLRAQTLCLLLLQNSLHLAQMLLLGGSRAALQLARPGLAKAARVGRAGRKASEDLRRKLWFEFMVFVLGGGNGLFLLVFWPGWIVVLGFYGAWRACV